jgi:hypothetical protein
MAIVPCPEVAENESVLVVGKISIQSCLEPYLYKLEIAFV